MGTATIQIADGIGLEEQTINDPRALSLGFPGAGDTLFLLFFFIARSFQLFRRRILEEKRQALAVGRPHEAADVLNGVGEQLGFAAQAVEQVHLGLSFVTLGVLALGEEGDELSIG
jgi:hypothetical protein